MEKTLDGTCYPLYTRQAEITMEAEQNQIQTEKTAGTLQTCGECGRSFTRSQFLDHLFHNKDCMRRYWEEEEKTHVFRLRHHRTPKNA